MKCNHQEAVFFSTAHLPKTWARLPWGKAQSKRERNETENLTPDAKFLLQISSQLRSRKLSANFLSSEENGKSTQAASLRIALEKGAESRRKCRRHWLLKERREGKGRTSRSCQPRRTPWAGVLECCTPPRFRACSLAKPAQNVSTKPRTRQRLHFRPS